MRSPQEEIETVRTMAETMVKINHKLHGSVSSVDFPEVDLTQAEGATGIELTDKNFDQINIDGAEGWWNAWCEVREILNESFEDDIIGGESVTMSEIEPNGNMRIKNDSVHLQVRLYNGVGVSYIAEYYVEGADTWVMLYEDDAPQEGFETSLTRNFVRTELAIIANTTQSAAETLDYWMTERGDSPWTQSSWGDVRGVGRQTVNDRVRSAVEKLETNTK